MPGKRAVDVTVRNFAMPDGLFSAARDQATSDGMSLSEVVRRLLAAYLTEYAVRSWVCSECAPPDHSAR